MVTMHSLRTFTLYTTKGHCIRFEAKKPREVPNEIVQEAMTAGCVPVDENDIAGFEDLSRAKVEFQGDLRKSILYLAMEVFAHENNPKNFNAGGRPKANILSERLGFEVGSAETQSSWENYLSVKNSGSDVALHPNAKDVVAVISAEDAPELRALASKQGIPPTALEGLTVREIRKVLLTKLNGVTPTVG